MSNENDTDGVRPARGTLFRRLRQWYSRRPIFWNTILCAFSISAFVVWVNVYTNWTSTAHLLIVAAQAAWTVICMRFDKPVEQIPDSVLQSLWWLIVPALAALLWAASLVALPVFMRNQVVVTPREVLASTAAREEGWHLRVLQNGKPVCEVRPYHGQTVVCGGANSAVLDAEMRPFAARWKGGDKVIVLCFDPKSLDGREYECGKAEFPPYAKKQSLAVEIDA